MAEEKKKNDTLIAVRIKADQKLRIRTLAIRHELPESIVIRKALSAGLRNFEEGSLLNDAR